MTAPLNVSGRSTSNLCPRSLPSRQTDNAKHYNLFSGLRLGPHRSAHHPLLCSCSSHLHVGPGRELDAHHDPRHPADVHLRLSALRDHFPEDLRDSSADTLVSEDIDARKSHRRDASATMAHNDFAPPRTAPHAVTGWEQQQTSQPWIPTSPDTMVAGGKHAGAKFSWVVEHDVLYVGWLLDHTAMGEGGLWELSRFLHEHYQRAT